MKFFLKKECKLLLYAIENIDFGKSSKCFYNALNRFRKGIQSKAMY